MDTLERAALHHRVHEALYGAPLEACVDGGLLALLVCDDPRKALKASILGSICFLMEKGHLTLVQRDEKP